MERDLYTHAGRVIGRLENGHNTSFVRQEAVRIIQSGAFPQSSQVLDTLHYDLVTTWRGLGQVDDSQLDTIAPKDFVTSKSR